MSSAGAHPKNEASEIPLYGDIRVLSAVRTILGCFILSIHNHLRALDIKLLISDLEG